MTLPNYRRMLGEALTLVVLFAVPRTGTRGVGAQGKTEILPASVVRLGQGQTANCLFKDVRIFDEATQAFLFVVQAAQRKLPYNARQYECSSPAVAFREVDLS